jgi:hypothetical protein
LVSVVQFVAPIDMPEWSNGERFDAAAILSREVELLFLLAGRERCNLFRAPCSAGEPFAHCRASGKANPPHYFSVWNFLSPDGLAGDMRELVRHVAIAIPSSKSGAL